jgi:hypothetical protein
MKIKKFNESDSYIEQFDEFVQVLYDIHDKYNFIEIRFSSREFGMNIEEYVNKGNKYDRFIDDLDRRITFKDGIEPHSFQVTFNIKREDLNVYIEILKLIKSERIKSTGWHLYEFESNNFEKITYQRANYIIRATFKFI